MPFRSRNIARETVTALAVMAIYILVLLAPLHQAAGLQRDLGQLGYAALDGWSICTPLAPQTEKGKPPAVVKCAVSGIGKNEIAAIAPATVDLGIVRIADVVSYARSDPATVVGPDRSPGQPRGPPQS